MSIFVHVFLGLFVAIGLGILAYGGMMLRKSNEASSWPTTEGTVLEHDLVQQRSRKGSAYEVKVSYAYTVEGARYESSRIAFGYGASSGLASHQSIHERFKDGSTVVVHYDPARPAESVLSYGLTRGILLLFVFGVVWTIFSVGMYVLLRVSEAPDTTLLDNLIVK